MCVTSALSSCCLIPLSAPGSSRRAALQLSLTRRAQQPLAACYYSRCNDLKSRDVFRGKPQQRSYRERAKLLSYFIPSAKITAPLWRRGASQSLGRWESGAVRERRDSWRLLLLLECCVLSLSTPTRGRGQNRCELVAVHWRSVVKVETVECHRRPDGSHRERGCHIICEHFKEGITCFIAECFHQNKGWSSMNVFTLWLIISWLKKSLTTNTWSVRKCYKAVVTSAAALPDEELSFGFTV